MGYCRGDCEYLTSRHNCKKYHKSLAYSNFSSKSLAYSSHERCSECEKDHRIMELEAALKEKWITAEEHPPEEGLYICTFDGELIGAESPFTGSCGFYNGKWDEEESVLAWMPLPEPYRPQVLKNADNDTTQPVFMPVC